ncbi:MAG: CDP-alcohol phosphatidyltransferase family protein [Oscillospiraceae bacterium]|nr:CDP-alcohol phosphatidyltransferase family protein [Oscillospiraceae bacterium]
MFIKDWKKEVFTIPNMLSLFRLALIPVYIVIYLNAKEPHDYYLAGGILAVSCLTDLIDGKIARHFNMISNLGKLLDPIADKFTQLGLTICLSVRYPILRSVLVLFLVKEFYQGIVGLIHLRKGQVLPGALMAGKICTTVLFVSLTLLVLLPNICIHAVNTIAVIDTVCLIYSFIMYTLAYFGKHTKLQDIED